MQPGFTLTSAFVPARRGWAAAGISPSACRLPKGPWGRLNVKGIGTLSQAKAWHPARGGKAGLKSRPQTRRTGRLSAAQRNRLGRFLARPPESHGFRAMRWTLPLVVRLIRKHFGVEYHPGHVWRIVRSLKSLSE